MVKYEREPSMRLGVALPKSVQKSKRTIFDKTNKTGHQTNKVQDIFLSDFV